MTHKSNNRYRHSGGQITDLLLLLPLRSVSQIPQDRQDRLACRAVVAMYMQELEKDGRLFTTYSFY